MKFLIRITVLVLIFGVLPLPADQELKGPYLGQKPPGMVPEMFAPGIVSSGVHEMDITVSPDGKEIFFTRSGPDYFKALLYLKQADGRWEGPLMASFADSQSFSHSFVHPNGKIMFCESKADIYQSQKGAQGWTAPVPLSPAINTRGREGFVSVASNGNLYFTAKYRDTLGGYDLYRSEYKNGEYEKPRNLGDAVNSEHHEFHACIAPDERYIVFDSRRPDSLGGNDLYISFRNRDGSWTKARNLGEPINSGVHDLKPYITADGKYLFFGSTRSIPRNPDKDRKLSYKAFMKKISGPGNGSQDIYWVDAKILEDLRPEESR